MTMQITQMMVERIKEAIPKLDDVNTFVEIPDMGGYFVTPCDKPIPEKAKRIVEVGIEGVCYLVYNTLEEEGT